MAIVSGSSRLSARLALTIITFPYRIDRWDDGNSVPELLADIDHLIVARAIYEAARKRWPRRRITLLREARVIEDSRKTRVSRLL
jgi:hypothetical protein